MARAAEEAVNDINVSTVLVLVVALIMIGDKIFRWHRESRDKSPSTLAQDGQPIDLEAVREKAKQEGREEVNRENEISRLSERVETDREQILGVKDKVDAMARTLERLDAKVDAMGGHIDDLRKDVRGREPVEEIVRRITQPERDKLDDVIRMLEAG